MNIWQSLPKPILILAPMDDVTDVVFRQIITEVGKPTLLFTEFTNCDGLNSPGREKLLTRLRYTPEQKPIIAQIWGADPDTYFKSAQLIEEMGFDGIDINLGCPQHDVLKQGCCAALINFPHRVKQLIEAVKAGAPNTPLSIKTRIGVNQIITEDWIGFLLEQDLAAITVHGRTAKEMSKVPAHWDEIGKAVQLKNKIAPQTILIGNGDVQSVAEAHSKVQEYGVDGVMIGRGIFNNIWMFKTDHPDYQASLHERFSLLLTHLDLFHQTWGTTQNFAIIRKFVKAYINGFNSASEIRQELMTCQSYEELKQAIQTHQESLSS